MPRPITTNHPPHKHLSMLIITAAFRKLMKILKTWANVCCCCFTMVTSHKRLQTYRHHYGTVCMTGMYGCRWHRYKQSTEESNKWDLAWFTVLLLAVVYMLFLLNYWISTENSEDLFNWYIFNQTGMWEPVLKILLALTAVVVAYVVLITLLGLCHVCVGHQLFMHWLHRVTLVLILAACVAITIFLDYTWRAGWSLQLVSLQITGPFIHIGLACVMTSVSWLIAGKWMQVTSKGWKVVLLGLYLAVMLAVFIFPPFLDSPCVVEHADLPAKPLLTAHRGGAAVAPENTLYAFQYAAATLGVYALETDVAISTDGVPFLLHDDTFERTTNIHDVFPKRASQEACWFNSTEIQQLNAGSWFIKKNPFGTVADLTEESKEIVRNQRVPTLLQYLELARDQNTKVIFDIKMLDEKTTCKGHPYNETIMTIILSKIKDSRIPPQNVLWLYWDEVPHTAQYNFTKVAPAKHSHMTDTSFLLENHVSLINAQFSHVNTRKIRDMHWYNMTVNMYVVDASWLFSLYWCAGAHSVTTNQIHRLSTLSKPVWHLTPSQFQIMWVTTDVLAAVTCLIIWIVQRVRHSGKTFHTEAISLQGARLRKTHQGRNRTMKEKLLYTAESIQEIDAAGIQGVEEMQHPGQWSAHSPDGNCHPPQTDSQFSTLSHGGSSGGDSNSARVQLHRMSRVSGTSGISGISAISGLGVGDSSFSGGMSDDEGRMPNARLSDARLSDVKLEIIS